MNIYRKTTLGLSFALLSAAAFADSGLTRAEVKAELTEAIRTGDVIAYGDSGQKLNEIFADRYPAKPVAFGKTRAEVKVELAHAIRTGDMLAGGESGQKLNELTPHLYPMPAHGRYAATSPN